MIQELRRSDEPASEPGHEGPQLGRSLVHDGVITDEEYASALSRSEQFGHSIWTALRGVASLILPGRSHPRGWWEAEQEPPASGAGPGPSAGSVGPLVTPGRFPSVPALVSGMFEEASRCGGTDIHLDPDADAVRIRIRIDGFLHEAGSLPEELARQVRSRIKVLAGIDPLERAVHQDGHISLASGDGRRDFRVATLLTGMGERMVIRFHLEAARARSLDGLGLDTGQVAAVRRLLNRPQGLILVAGPIGSGKTTTLYACLRELARPTRSLVTIEDPIEHRLDGAVQIEVRPHLGLTFARGLRAILRQDADVIVIGEIRDRETARVAARAATAGALVLSSVHAADAPGVLRCLAHWGVPPSRIGEGLAGVIAQRLVRTLCEACKRPADADRAPLSAPVAQAIDVDEVERATPFEPTGCPRCLGTGFHGRTGVFEVIEFEGHGGVPGGVPERPRSPTAGRSCDLLVAASRLVGRGLTTLEEVGRVLPIRSEARGDLGPPASPSARPGEEPDATGAGPGRDEETIRNP